MEVDLPEVHFGSATEMPRVDWRKDADVDPDDEQIVTPKDVVMMLGFDPADVMELVAEDAAEFNESDHPRAPDGKFGSGGGHQSKSAAAKKQARSSKSSTTKAVERAPVTSAVKQAQANVGSETSKKFIRLMADAERDTYDRIDAKSPSQFVLDNGRSFAATDATYVGKRGTMKQCYMNAAKAAQEDHGLTYVEGYVTVHGVPIKHAWTVDGDGSVVDQTITSGENVGDYFGVPFSTDYLNRTLVENGTYGLLGHHSKKTLEPLLKGEVDDFTAGGKVGPLATPSTFSAHDYAKQYNNNAVKPSDILAKFPPEVATKIAGRILDINHAVSSGQDTQSLHKKDGRYTPERSAVHAKIIEHFLSPEKIADATPPAGEKPTFTLLGGRGGSGKSWFTSDDGLVDPKKNVVLDADAIKEMLPEYEGWNAGLLHEESSDLFDHMTDVAQELGLNIVHDATMKTGHKAVALVSRFKGAGYGTEAHYMYLPPQEAAVRGVKRFMGPNGRFVPPGIILGNTTNEASFNDVKRIADKWSFRDNQNLDGSGPKLVMQSS